MTEKAHSKRIEIRKIKIGDTVMSTEQWQPRPTVSWNKKL